jgi:hypothetical protein
LRSPTRGSESNEALEASLGGGNRGDLQPEAAGRRLGALCGGNSSVVGALGACSLGDLAHSETREGQRVAHKGQLLRRRLRRGGAAVTEKWRLMAASRARREVEECCRE